MPLKCDGGDANGYCEACAQAQAVSLEVSKEIIDLFADKKLSGLQEVQAATIGMLTAVELLSGKDNILTASYLVNEIMDDWINRVVTSQNVELKKTNSVANIIPGNKTLN